MLDTDKETHRRLNPLTREWVLVSPHRTARPWQGQIDEQADRDRREYDPNCYLCPGNLRANGESNPDYKTTLVFENDFAAMTADGSDETLDEEGLITAIGERGICRVVCFSPKHNLTFARMNAGEIREVVDVWAEQYRELGSVPWINSVQIFENRGAMMGASNAHPHGQIWANATVPNELAKEVKNCDEFFERRAKCLLCTYLEIELREKKRIVFENDGFAAVVPFWAVWPFEILVLPKRHFADLEQLDAETRQHLAETLGKIAAAYDCLFDTPFPYTMGFHQRPTDGESHINFHMHAHFYPPLLRSATVRKFMVGYEMLAMPQRDITPEQAAEKLRPLFR